MSPPLYQPIIESFFEALGGLFGGIREGDMFILGHRNYFFGPKAKSYPLPVNELYKLRKRVTDAPFSDPRPQGLARRIGKSIVFIGSRF